MYVEGISYDASEEDLENILDPMLALRTFVCPVGKIQVSLAVMPT